MGGWREIELGCVATMSKGIAYGSENYCDEGEGYIFITLKCIAKSGGFSRRGIKFYKGYVPDNMKLRSGDLLLANTDLTRAGDVVGCPILLPDLGSEQPVTMSMDLSKLVLNENEVDREFLYYYLMTDRVRRFMKDHSSGSTVLHLQTSKVPSLKLKIPENKTEQKIIAVILSRVDRAIELTEALIAKQQRLKTGLMQKLLTKGIDEHGNIRSEATHEFKDSPLGRIPKDWEIRKLTQVAEYQNGGAFPSAEYGNAGIPLLRPGNLPNDDFVVWDNAHTIFLPVHWAQLAMEYIVGEGELVMNLTAQSLEEQFLGRVCMTPPGTRCLLNQRIARIRAKQSHLPYLFWAFKGNFFRQQIDRLTQGTKVQHIYNSNLEAILLAFPKSSDEQTLIADILFAHSSNIRVEKTYRETLQTIKTGLMQDLLTGRVSVSSLLRTQPITTQA